MKRFKQFLESEEREVYAKKIDEAPEFTPALADSDYSVGNLIFSAKDGLGSVPNSSDPYYFGFVAEVTPDTFLRLALPHTEERLETMENLAKLVVEGYALGVPFLVLEVTEEVDKPPRIRGHEGRARVLLTKKINGSSSLLPIHVFLAGGMRGYHINRSIMTRIKNGVMNEDGTKFIKSPFEAVYLQGNKV